jgi:hypothetical protein
MSSKTKISGQLLALLLIIGVLAAAVVTAEIVGFNDPEVIIALFVGGCLILAAYAYYAWPEQHETSEYEALVAYLEECAKGNKVPSEETIDFLTKKAAQASGTNYTAIQRMAGDESGFTEFNVQERRRRLSTEVLQVVPEANMQQVDEIVRRAEQLLNREGEGGGSDAAAEAPSTPAEAAEAAAAEAQPTASGDEAEKTA